MNQTHIHLLITHLPIFGSVFGSLVLAHGLWTKTIQTKIAAYNLLILSSLGAVIAYSTGEAAEETVENIQGVLKSAIDQHEDFAIISLIALIVMGVLSVAALYLTLKKSTFTKSIAQVILFVSLISFGLVARTGYLGGQIRHTELNSSNINVNQGGGEEEKDE